ncbi:MAG: hypothetical protein K0R24_2239 [Gammaproteobacteria bacterium]|jgi:hypothetical protein|nr:hypothetical protein [Gammaproteobacteria bacterium]MCE3239258.1 hypothetical protein [Gammaproteobacteria bacterium]
MSIYDKKRIRRELLFYRNKPIKLKKIIFGWFFDLFLSP